MLQLDEWLVLWQEAVVNEFGPGRVRFMGIQGSRARGEAHEGSDIDVVLILDELTPDDLVRYRACVAQLPERDKLCGSSPARKSCAAGSAVSCSSFAWTPLRSRGRWTQ